MSRRSIIIILVLPLLYDELENNGRWHHLKMFLWKMKQYHQIFAASLFIFDPRIIQNSTLGITESLFLILLTSSIILINENVFVKSYVAKYKL